MTSIKEKIRLSSTSLKLFAIIIMLIDHFAYGYIHHYLQNNAFTLDPNVYTRINKWYEYLRNTGRLAFPIFAFLLVEGFFHTRNVVKYAVRMGIFALISEIPFNLGLYHSILYKDHQNVMFTLFIGILMLIMLDYYKTIPGLSTALLWVLNVSTLTAAMDIAQLTHCDYRWKGILLIFILYIFREYKPFNLLSGAAAISWEKFGPASFLLLYFYDETKKPSKNIKYLFYLFYPAHLILIYLIYQFLQG